MPSIDYAAITWYEPGKYGVVRLAYALDKVQRLGARMILRAWKKVALLVLEAEAYLETTAKRLQRKVSVRTVKLPCSNSARNAMPDTLNVSRLLSPLSATIAAHKNRIRPKGLGAPVSDPAWIQAPWTDHGYRAAIKPTDYSKLLSTEAGLRAVTKWFVEQDVLAQFSLARRMDGAKPRWRGRRPGTYVGEDDADR